MKIKFIGAAGGSVTGSCTHFYYPRTKTSFLVDCGLVQGEGDFESINANPFPFDAASIQFVLLTHAHLDHCGLLPKLYRSGFAGEVICTAATAEMARLSLMDSAGYKNSLFTKNEVQQIRFKAIEDHPNMAMAAMFPVRKDLFVSFRRTAHIIGSCSITIGWLGDDDKRHFILMSGDLGNNTKDNLYQPLLAHRQSIFGYPDTIIVESTYGDRARPTEHKSFEARIDALRGLLHREIFERKSILVVPAFSLQRTQEFLLDLVVVLNRFYSSAGSATAPYLPANHFHNCFSGEHWNWVAHDAVRRAISNFSPEDRAQWSDAFTESGDENFPHQLRDGSPRNLQDLQSLLASQREPFSIDVILDSKLARAMGVVIRKELMRQSAHKQGEMAHRNPEMMGRLNCKSETELQTLLLRLLPDTDTDSSPFAIGPHTVHCCAGAATPRIAESLRRGKILITGGGMCDGGPVVEHLQKLVTQKRESVLVQTGYMAKHSLGKRLIDLARDNETGQARSTGIITIGTKEDISCEDIRLRAVDISGYYSGHADQEGLLEFIFATDGRTSGNQPPQPATVFINHGSPVGRQGLQEAIAQRQAQAAPGDRAIRNVELPAAGRQTYDLSIGQWVEDSEVLSAEEGMAALLREQIKTNELLRQVLAALNRSSTTPANIKNARGNSHAG